VTPQVPSAPSRAAGPSSLGAHRTAAWPAVSAAVVAVAAAVLAGVAVSSAESTLRLTCAVAGYVLGAVVVSVLATVHRTKENRGRRSTEFRPRPAWGVVVRVSFALGLLAALGAAFVLATEVAKW